MAAAANVSSTQRNSTFQTSPTWRCHTSCATTTTCSNQKRQGTPELTGKRLASPVRHRRRMAPSCQPDRTDEGMNGWREWDGRPGPTTAKRLRASEKELLSRSPSPTPPLKNPPLNLFKKKKKIPKLNFLCVCVHMCMSECVPDFLFLFSFLAWCQMFQLSTAVQHRW